MPKPPRDDAPPRPNGPALLVAHGAPSAPMGPEAALAQLAAHAAARAGRPVRAATLAAPGALDAAFARVAQGETVTVFPHFMTDGWFVSAELRRRAALAIDARGGGVRARFLAPFGMAAPLPALCARMAMAGAREAGLDPARTTLTLAAHGSPSDPRPARATREAAARIARLARFRTVRVGFVDQAPSLVEALAHDGPAICLPFFASHAGHVEIDLPAAIAEARFRGPVLTPVGADPLAAQVIAAALIADVAVKA